MKKELLLAALMYTPLHSAKLGLGNLDTINIQWKQYCKQNQVKNKYVPYFDFNKNVKEQDYKKIIQKIPILNQIKTSDKIKFKKNRLEYRLPF